ncbi:MAG: hypothetical protein O3C32_10330 [Bacteroidetes bacterium]|nr:hypothetical protein [Bacteroidota bacterium]
MNCLEKNLFFIVCSFLIALAPIHSQHQPSEVFETETEGWGYAAPNFFRVELWISGEGATAADAEKEIKRKGEAIAKKMGEGSTTSFSSTYGPPMFGNSRGIQSQSGEIRLFRSFGFPIAPAELDPVLTMISGLNGVYVLRLVPLSDRSAAEIQAQQTALQKSQTWVEAMKGRGNIADNLIIKNIQVLGCSTFAHFPGWADFPAIPVEGNPLNEMRKEERPLEVLPEMMSVRCKLKVIWEKP